MLPPALRQQLLRKRRRPEGAATCLALSPSLFSPVCLFLSPNRHTPDTCATHCLLHIHTRRSVTHTETSRHEIHEKLAGCLCSNKTLKINQVKLIFFDGICCLFCVLPMKTNYQQFDGNKLFFPYCFLSR